MLKQKGRSYGYDLAGELAQYALTDAAIEKAALYRTLRQLESNGYVISEWEAQPSAPARRVYSLTAQGEMHLLEWADVLGSLSVSMASLRDRIRLSLLLMGFVSLFAAFAPIAVVGQMTSIGTMFAFILVSGGIIVMRLRSPNLERPFRTPWVPLVPIASIAVNLLLMAGLGWSNWARLLVWLALGLAVYFRRRRSRIEAVPAESAV